MIWTEIELGCHVPDDRLRDAWAHAFGVAPEAIAIIADIAEEDPWVDPQTRVVLERYAQAGEFPLHVEVILRDDELIEAVADQARPLAMVQRICAWLNCRALIADASLDPYVRLLVAPNDTARLVELAPEYLDAADAFVLAKNAALAGPVA